MMFVCEIALATAKTFDHMHRMLSLFVTSPPLFRCVYFSDRKQLCTRIRLFFLFMMSFIFHAAVEKMATNQKSTFKILQPKQMREARAIRTWEARRKHAIVRLMLLQQYLMLAINGHELALFLVNDACVDVERIADVNGDCEGNANVEWP